MMNDIIDASDISLKVCSRNLERSIRSKHVQQKSSGKTQHNFLEHSSVGHVLVYTLMRHSIHIQTIVAGHQTHFKNLPKCLSEFIYFIIINNLNIKELFSVRPGLFRKSVSIWIRLRVPAFNLQRLQMIKRYSVALFI